MDKKPAAAFIKDASTARIVQMLFAVFLGRGLMAVRQLVVVPLLLSYWGTEYYGEWLMLSSIPTFLAMSNLGLGTAAGNQIAIDVAAGRISQAKSVYATITTALLVIAAVVVFGTWLFCQSGMLTNFIAIASPGLTLTLLVAGLIPRMMAGTIRGWWVGIGRAAANNHWMNALSALELVGIFAVVAAGFGSVEVAGVICVISLLWLVSLFMQTHSLILKSTFSEHKSDGFSFLIVKKMLSSGLGHQLSPLWQAIYFQGSILVAGKLFGAEGAATWGSIRVFIRAGAQLLELVSQSIGPEFQIAYAGSDWKKLNQLRAAGKRYSYLLSFICVVLLIAVGQRIFEFWTDSKLSVSNSVWVVSCLSLIPFAVWWLDGEFLRAINAPWKINLALTAIGIASLVSIFLLSSFGLLSLGLSALFFDVVAAVAISQLVRAKISELSLRTTPAV